jgi:hypothetical protein
MSEVNPFAPADADRHAIWEIVVRRDSDFFLSGDWSIAADDYVEEGFIGIDAGGQGNPDNWKIGFETLADYRRAAIEGWMDPAEFAEDLRTAWYRCQSLNRIDITGDLALAHKHIDGAIARADGASKTMRWRSIFFMRRHEGRWKITGFIGYLPL